MSETSRHVTTSDGRHRVAYEMAIDMWMRSTDERPTLNDEVEFLRLVKACTQALAHRDG